MPAAVPSWLGAVALAFAVLLLVGGAVVPGLALLAVSGLCLWWYLRT